ncbi:MAG: hypothetical protein WBM13_14120 [Bacteroidia bacterium]
MKRIIFFFIFIAHTAFSQSNYKLIASLPLVPDFLTTDKQGNIYIVKANELSKYNKAGKLTYKYSNKNLGNIDYVDASNMLRLLVFYQNFAQVLFLDNTLTQQGEPLSLDKIGFVQTQLVASSYNNGMWLYEQQNMQLVRLDNMLFKTQETGNLSRLLNSDITPTRLLEYDNMVYLYNPSSGILMFDIYGTYYKTIPAPNINSFQPLGDKVYYLKESTIKSYNYKTLEEQSFEIPPVVIKKFRIEMDVLIIQTSDAVNIYTED